ncbi:DUF2829 domain-containing protein [Xenorhabdus lircayensis]|uniref:DUF2829 domain-containing protein n=1 Tax=Xenorhabdus lircayensis TaxID=2763499 RepID=A0ABS0U7I3_9GAMM|nr:DUF2829 domain-containing protein [Xenorhabdus lircayensis]MBI6549843.1 DUF2829 domain-containing protein [Xenorhabdus lircayensis]
MSEFIKSEHECEYKSADDNTGQIIALEGSFWWALIQLKLGNKARRSDWLETEHVRFIPRDADTESQDDYLAHIDKRNKQGHWAPWQPTQEDLMSDDWELVKEAVKPELDTLIFDLTAKMGQPSGKVVYWGYKSERGGLDESMLPFGSLNVIQNSTVIQNMSSLSFSVQASDLLHLRVSSDDNNYQKMVSLVKKNLHVTVDNVTYSLGASMRNYGNKDYPYTYDVYYEYGTPEYPILGKLGEVLKQTGKTYRFHLNWHD